MVTGAHRNALRSTALPTPSVRQPLITNETTPARSRGAPMSRMPGIALKPASVSR